MPSATPGYAPDLDKYLRSLKGRPVEASVENLTCLLKRRQICGSEPCAVATAHVLRQVVARSKWHDVHGLLEAVSAVGGRLVAAQPRELVVANIVRRVLALIRDEAAEDRNEASSEAPSAPMTPTGAAPPPPSWPAPAAVAAAGGDGAAPRPGLVPSHSFVNVPRSLFRLLSASPPPDSAGTGRSSPFANSGTSTPTTRGAATPHTSQVHALRSEVIDGIEEILDEIGQVDDQIAALAEAHIHPGDRVLVHRPSPTVERFMLRAAAKRSFTVLVAAEAPRRHGGEHGAQHGRPDDAAFAARLAAAGVDVMRMRSAGLMGYMPVVNKVVLGARAVLADGGVVADAGAGAVARAAREHGHAVLVLAGVYRLSPDKPFDEESLIEWGDPATFVSYADGAVVNDVEVRTAVTELVPPELVDAYITNLGTHPRNYLPSLIADHYKHEDAGFDLWSAAGL